MSSLAKRWPADAALTSRVLNTPEKVSQGQCGKNVAQTHLFFLLWWNWLVQLRRMSAHTARRLARSDKRQNYLSEAETTPPSVSNTKIDMLLSPRRLEINTGANALSAA